MAWAFKWRRTEYVAVRRMRPQSTVPRRDRYHIAMTTDQAMSLLDATVKRTSHALATGALDPIETESETLVDAGVRFIVRRVSSLARKAAGRALASAYAPARDGDDKAFPVEPDLLVRELSATHFALLNKYPVIAHHVLLVTRSYAPQEALLDAADFQALAICLSEFEGLGFYNGGAAAGASQPHKHLQVVPLPLGDGDAVPIAVLFDLALAETGGAGVKGLPFRHAFARTGGSASVTGGRLLELYRELLTAAGITGITREGVPHQSAPYNMLVTTDWMLVVPRLRADFAGVSINALGYAGSIFVKNATELARVRETGPMAMLQGAAVG
jgi:ATP adenylyltransferase